MGASRCETDTIVMIDRKSQSTFDSNSSTQLALFICEFSAGEGAAKGLEGALVIKTRDALANITFAAPPDTREHTTDL